MKTLFYCLLAAALLPLCRPLPAHAEGGAHYPPQHWSFQALPGQWNKAELLRGYTVATQVCLACHSFKYFTHRDLMQVGFTESEVKTLANALKMNIDQPLKTAMDDETAKATFGKVPPDLSLMTKAREGGPDYVYAVLTGFSDDSNMIGKDFPKGMPPGTYFNHAFPGHAIAMPPPLSSDNLVTYSDGTSATIPQMAHDVVTFLDFVAEPERVERQKLGAYVLLYLAIFTILAYLTKRAIWKDVKGH